MPLYELDGNALSPFQTGHVSRAGGLRGAWPQGECRPAGVARIAPVG